jgi:hypothetical protein
MLRIRVVKKPNRENTVYRLRGKGKPLGVSAEKPGYRGVSFVDLLRYRHHRYRDVRAQDLIAKLSNQARETPCATGEVEHRFDTLSQIQGAPKDLPVGTVTALPARGAEAVKIIV